MFWGLIMEPNKRYSQLVERSFHLSMASLDVTGANDQPVQVMLCYDNRNYLLCTLKKGSIFQVPLDLNFQEGTKIAFTCNGFGHVHLTGYLTLDEDLDFGDLEDEDEEEEEEEEIPQLVKPKRKAIESPKKASKKVKRGEESNEGADSSDDDNLDMDGESDSENGEHKMIEDDEDESDDESDDDDDEEDDSDDESETEVLKPKQKQKQNQQVQNQVGKKQEKQKMVNGKEAKQDLSKQKKNKPEQQQQNSQQQAKKRTIEGGVQVEELKVGNGPLAKYGKNVTVFYVGRLKNGKKFDETRQGEGFKFQLGKGEVIKGWDLGISGMKVGGKRRLTIPAAMGYGHKGSPPVIPGNSTLIFDVELKNVH